jgi:hypothetical protein
MGYRRFIEGSAFAALLPFAALLAGCDPGEVATTRDSGTRRDVAVQDGAMIDSATVAEDSATATDTGTTTPTDGGTTPTDGMVSMGPVRAEECGNNVDDDEDGEIDEGCTCAVGTERACYLGPEGTLNRGACRAGNQRCESTGARAVWGACAGQVLPSPEIASNGVDDDCNGGTDEPGAICQATVNLEDGTNCTNGRDDDCDGLIDCLDPSCAMATRCTTMRCPQMRETTCFGGVDEDCDGDIDCADTDCRSMPSCMPSPCPMGQTPTYTERVLTPQSGPSTIYMGDNQPNFTMTCMPGACPQGQVRVVRQSQPAICVPPPPMCPSDQSPSYRGAGWVCEGVCEIIIRYGYMFGFRRVCTQRPNIMCPSGQVPTFDFGSERWLCRPTCNNTTYDRINLGGLLVCIPC